MWQSIQAYKGHFWCKSARYIYQSIHAAAGGLVQVAHFSVLPDVGAGAAAAAVLASMVPLLVSVWRRPDPARFACCAALASLNR